MPVPTFPNPRGEAARELMALAERRRELAGRVRDIDAEREAAARDASDRSTELAALERQRAGGQDVDVRSAEKALTAARVLAGQPWAERLSGARAAVDDADKAIARHCTEGFDGIVAELAEDAEQAARAIDIAMQAVLDGYAERARIAANTDALVSTVMGRSDYGLVRLSRVETLARDIDRVLAGGGEQAPVLARDPRPQEATA